MKIVKKIKPFHVDERGEMSHLLDNASNITSVLYITCKKGAIRANHYHKKDTHYSYMVEGSMEYTYKNLKTPASPAGPPAGRAGRSLEYKR
jgi:quercetin dioxygenase-like cupin family protein